jgi:hypothetical protein
LDSEETEVTEDSEELFLMPIEQKIAYTEAKKPMADAEYGNEEKNSRQQQRILLA